jgi:hypothetical protein
LSSNIAPVTTFTIVLTRRNLREAVRSLLELRADHIQVHEQFTSHPPIRPTRNQQKTLYLFSLLCLIWQHDRCYALEFGAQPLPTYSVMNETFPTNFIALSKKRAIISE